MRGTDIVAQIAIDNLHKLFTVIYKSSDGDFI